MAMLNNQRVTWILRPAMGMISHKLTMIPGFGIPEFCLGPWDGGPDKEIRPFSGDVQNSHHQYPPTSC